MDRIVCLLAAALLLAACSGSADSPLTTTTATTAGVTSTTVAPPSSTTTAPTTVAPVEAPPAEIQIDRDIAYGTHERHRLDVLYRDGRTDAPTVLLIHGGGFRDGDKGGQGPTAEFFVNRGFVAVTTNYRLIGADGENAFPAGVNDVACAAAWLHEHASDYGGDPTTMFVSGYSAGGHLSAMLAVDPQGGWLYDCPTQDVDLDFDGLIGFAGTYDFETVLPHPAACGFLFDLLGPECDTSDPARWEVANPVDLVTPDDPPTLLIGADKDCVVSTPDPITGLCTDSYDRMAAALREAGVGVDLIVIPEGSHGDVGIDIPPISWAIEEFLRDQGIDITEPSQDPVPADMVAPSPESLAGAWLTSSSHPLVLMPDGQWLLLAKVVKLPWTWGSYTLDGDVLTLETADDALLLCHGTTGSYRAAISSDSAEAHFTLVSDPCGARSQEIVGGSYGRVPDFLVPGNYK